MQYYNEEKMKNLRLIFEKEILSWPECHDEKNVWLSLLQI